MRIALIADIHANLVALEAALADIATRRADHIVCLGDVAALGPEPHAVVERLRTWEIPAVMGNADAWVLAPPAEAGRAQDETQRRIEEIDRWCAGQLTAADTAYLHTFQPTISLPLADDGVLLCCHGSPRSYDDIILATTPAEEVEGMLAGAQARVIAGGHTHIQMLRRHRDLLLVNPGSVGLPVDRVAPAREGHNPSWAEYAIIDGQGGHLSVELHRTSYPVATVIAAVRASGMPHAEWFAGDWIAGDWISGDWIAG